MPRLLIATFLAAALGGLLTAQAQQAQAAAEQSFVAGTPLDMTPNAKT